jgi:small GTP-binding protein
MKKSKKFRKLLAGLSAFIMLHTGVTGHAMKSTERATSTESKKTGKDASKWVKKNSLKTAAGALGAALLIALGVTSARNFFGSSGDARSDSAEEARLDSESEGTDSGAVPGDVDVSKIDFDTTKITNVYDYLKEFKKYFGSQRARLVLVGDSGVGKDVIFGRLQSNRIFFETRATVGVGWERIDGYDCCNTPGDESYRTYLPIVLRNANIVLIVYDITNNNSFKNVRPWLELVEEHAAKAKKVLIGNKIDLEDCREIETDVGQKFADENVFHFFVEVSAVTGKNIRN